MKVVAIIQARMNSTRLPRKVLADVQGRPLLWHVVARTRRAKHVDEVVVATSDRPADDELAAYCTAEGVACFRGSENDVLDRYYRAAQAHGATAVVRITGDCPLIDPAVIDRVIETFLDQGVDYTSNCLRPTFPEGLDFEIWSVTTLETVWREATKPSDREHVAPYLKTSGKFRCANVEAELPHATEERWSVDEPQDLELVRAIFAAFKDRPGFGYRDVLDLLAREPAIRQIQKSTMQNEGYYKGLYAQAKAGAAPKRPIAQSEAWLDRARKVVPGCAQTFSKGANQYVQGVSPIFLKRGKGCRVWDVDGNEYIDYVQGLLPNILGYAHDEVNAAAAAQLAEGHSFTLPHPLEVELAERLTRLIPCAEMVRFGKNGSDATAGAVRASRAFTGRERVACCGYHGWQDWFIGTTTRNGGVPAAVRGLTHPFPYNDLAALEKVLTGHPGEFAAVIMEPVNFFEPAPGYLDGVKKLAHEAGALLIFDEICSGFHFGIGGAQKRYGVTPDLACFGKAMGSGFPISCIVGRRDVMRIFEDIFVSFTFGGEVASMAAAMKVLDILEQTNALADMKALGQRLQDGFNTLAREAGLAAQLQCIGDPVWSLLKLRDAEGRDSLLVRSLFQQEAVKRGILLLTTHNFTAAHDYLSTEQTLEAYAAIVKTLASWLGDKDPSRFLEGGIIQSVFRVR